MPGYIKQYDENWNVVSVEEIPDCEFCGCCPCHCGKSPEINDAFGIVEENPFRSRKRATLIFIFILIMIGTVFLTVIDTILFYLPF